MDRAKGQVVMEREKVSVAILERTLKLAVSRVPRSEKQSKQTFQDIIDGLN